jgi:hypothetical protein
MFVTKRAQSLHDMAAGSAVHIRNPNLALRRDYFVPVALATGKSLPTRLRRIIVISGYSVLLIVIVAVGALLLVSPACLLSDVCSTGDDRIFTLVGYTWLIGLAAIVFAGWTGRLIGCRSRAMIPTREVAEATIGAEPKP